MYFRKVPSSIQKLFPSIIWSPRSDARLHLTFDDGPHPQSTPTLLAILDRLNIKATFFCLGNKLEAYPELGLQIREHGHLIGNHGYEHLSGWKTSNAEYLLNSNKGEEISKSKLYRPPYGKMNLRQYKMLKRKYNVVLWSKMPGDFDPLVTKEVLAERLDKCSTEDIVVLHDLPMTVEKLSYALPLCYG